MMTLYIKVWIRILAIPAFTECYRLFWSSFPSLKGIAFWTRAKIGPGSEIHGKCIFMENDIGEEEPSNEYVVMGL